MIRTCFFCFQVPGPGAAGGPIAPGTTSVTMKRLLYTKSTSLSTDTSFPTLLPAAQVVEVKAAELQILSANMRGRTSAVCRYHVANTPLASLSLFFSTPTDCEAFQGARMRCEQAPCLRHQGGAGRRRQGHHPREGAAVPRDAARSAGLSHHPQEADVMPWRSCTHK